MGKTYSALAVIKFFELQGYKAILLSPKKLSQNWKRYQKDRHSRFEQDGFEFFLAFHTDMQDDRIKKAEDGKIWPYLKNKAQQKLLVVIDESHNFRNDKFAKEEGKATRYEYLVKNILQVKAETKVLLLSATPINTKLLDVRNQFKLLCQGEDGGFSNFEELPGIHSLESQFRVAEAKLNEWIKDENPGKSIYTLVNKLPDSFFQLTDHLLVARTRDMVTKVESNLHFPKKSKPDNRFQDILNLGPYKSYMDLVDDMHFKLTAYQPAKFTAKGKEKARKKTEDEVQRQEYLVKMMFSLLAKRLESSWYSFAITLNNMLTQHKRALLKINLFERNPKGEDQIDDNPENNPEIAKILKALEEDESTGDLSLGKKSPLKISEIEDLSSFKTLIEKDVEDMERILAAIPIDWKEETPVLKARDYKLEMLVNLLLEKQQKKNKKVIVFTTYTDTAEYLFEQLKALDFNDLALVTGNGAQVKGEKKQADFEPVLERFAPFTKLYKERDWQEIYLELGLKKEPNFEEWKEIISEHDPEIKQTLENPVHILIATDCLSEGQNLQDADLLVNYDIYWNPVRLIQRMGRIDRLGSPNAEISGVNFWPAKDLEGYLKLRSRVEHRLASMLLVGAEIVDVSEKLEQLRSDNPLIEEQEKKFYSLMQESWDGIDTGPETFGLNDLSLDAFRQELLEELNNERKKYEGMPNGVFSGVRLRNDLFVNGLPEGLIALLGYPRRPDLSEEWQYEEHYLAYADPDGKQHFLTRQESLQILRDHKLENKQLSPGLENLDKARLNELQGWMEGWMDRKWVRVGGEAVQGLFHVNPQIPKTDEDKALEEKFRLKNFDLIAWMELNN